MRGTGLKSPMKRRQIVLDEEDSEPVIVNRSIRYE
jgi:hypothetical protein